MFYSKTCILYIKSWRRFLCFLCFLCSPDLIQTPLVVGIHKFVYYDDIIYNEDQVNKREYIHIWVLWGRFWEAYVIRDEMKNSPSFVKKREFRNSGTWCKDWRNQKIWKNIFISPSTFCSLSGNDSSWFRNRCLFDIWGFQNTFMKDFKM